MSLRRILPCASALALLLAAPALAQDGGGAAVTAQEAAPAGVSQSVPDAVPAQDETPTTPGGEEQPPAEQPDGEQPPSSEPSPPTATTPTGGVGGGESGGALPRTGWQAFALASIGLGLLLAGAALWPTSSWPPPRDRLSR